MARSLQRAREVLSREDLIGFDASKWAASASTGKERPTDIRSSASKVGGKIGTKAGVKSAPSQR